MCCACRCTRLLRSAGVALGGPHKRRKSQSLRVACEPSVTSVICHYSLVSPNTCHWPEAPVRQCSQSQFGMCARGSRGRPALLAQGRFEMVSNTSENRRFGSKATTASWQFGTVVMVVPLFTCDMSILVASLSGNSMARNMQYAAHACKLYCRHPSSGSTSRRPSSTLTVAILWKRYSRLSKKPSEETDSESWSRFARCVVNLY